MARVDALGKRSLIRKLVFSRAEAAPGGVHRFPLTLTHRSEYPGIQRERGFKYSATWGAAPLF